MANVGADLEATCQRDYQSEESFRQRVGHSLWKATYGLVGSFREETPQGIIVDITPGTGAWVKEATAIFHGRQICGIDVHACDWRYSHSCSCQPTGTPKCACKLAEPPNLEIGDRELNLPFDKNSAAFVNLRDTDLWLRDQGSLFDRIALILQPGGWLQHCETRLSGWNSNKPEVNQWRDHVIACARTLGCGLSSSVNVRKSLEERGFGDYRMSQRTWQTFGTRLNNHVLLFWKVTVKASRRILVEGGFGGPEAVDTLLTEVLLKLDEPDLRAFILAHSCLSTKEMERITFAERLPQDLREYISENPSVPACETEPARVEMKVYKLPSMKLTTYFPPGSKGRKLLNVHYPGGLFATDEFKDHSYCSNKAKECDCIVTSLQHTVPEDQSIDFRQILSDYSSAYQYLMQHLVQQWDSWEVSIVTFSASSIGFTVALAVAMMLPPPERPRALISAVPLVDTAPDLSHDPWGDNADAPGLTTSIFLDLLGRVFPPEIPGLRDHWHFNPSIIPKEVVDHLPNIHLVIGRYDILLKAQMVWVDQLEGYGKHVDYVKVDGLHKVKDLDRITEAGRVAREYLFEAVKMYVMQNAL